MKVKVVGKIIYLLMKIYSRKEIVLLITFVFFSVIIYSLLYMLTPEKSVNLIFEGNYNTTFFNNTLSKNG